MKTLSTAELRDMLSRHADFILVNVLSHDDFHREHIPGSANAPLDDPEFTRKVEALATGKRQKVVLYCSGPQCTASQTAAQKLEAAGFTDVCRYEVGMAGWKHAGLSYVEAAAPTGERHA